MRVNDRTIVLTGAGSGMGREVALELLRRGARVAAVDINEATLAETAALNNYVKPHVHDGDDFVVTDARHPVVERRTAQAGQPYPMAMTGLAGMAFLMEGSTVREGKYQAQLRRAVEWFLRRSQPRQTGQTQHQPHDCDTPAARHTCLPVRDL